MAAGPLSTLAKIKVGDAPIEVLSDVKSLQRQLRAFSKRIPMAYRNALNGSATKAKNSIPMLIRKRYNIDTKNIRPRLEVAPRAQVTKLNVAVKGRGRVMDIYKYARGNKKQTALGVRFNSGGGSKVHAHTFLATMPNGKTLIMVRSTSKSKRERRVSSKGGTHTTQLPIRALQYPSIAHMIQNPNVTPVVVAAFNKAMGTLYVQKLSDQLAKAKALR